MSDIFFGRFFFALKGLDRTAQGETLGVVAPFPPALNGRNSYYALSGLGM